jgi:hypothetical protein
MPKINDEKLKPFLVLTLIYVAFAWTVFLNELLSIKNSVPGGNYPMEHEFSWARVLVFCSGAIISAVLILIFAVKKHLGMFLPSFRFILLFAVPPVLISIISNYPSVSGWCCEVFPTRYYGFPFSYLRGNDLFTAFSQLEFTNIIRYAFRPYPFFLDFLFWSNIVFVVLSLVSLLVQKGKFIQQVKEQPKSSYPL